MLQTIHDKVTGWVAGIVIALIGIPFIFWGIDVGFGSVSYAAKVKGHEMPFWKGAVKVSLEDVNRAYQNQLNQYQQMTRGEVPPEVRTEIQGRLMDAFVRRELIEQHANQLGYRVRNEDVQRSIEQMPEFQVDGKYNEEVARRLLDSQAISRDQFRQDQRRELQVAQIQAAIAASSFVTPAEAARVRALESEEREVAWAIVDPATLAAGIEPADAAVADYYAKNKQSFMTPESVTLKYVEIRVADLMAQVAVTDEALRAHYDSVKDRYVDPERRRSRHILVKVDQESAEQAARKKADEVLVKAKSGADFSALAKELSEDAGSAEQGGDLGWAERSFFVGPFSDALFAMQVDEVRGPVRSEFGYHIIRLDGIEPGKQKAFEEVRAELENEYRAQESERVFGERQEQLAEKAFENLDSLDKVSDDMSLPIRSVPAFKRAGGEGAVGANAEVVAAAFSDEVLKNGQNSEPIEIEPGHVVVLRSEDRKEPKERPLAEVRGEIVALLKKQRAEQLAREGGDSALAKLKAGTPWATVVAELKVPAHGPKFATRTEAEIPGGLRQALFLAPKPAAGKPEYQGVALPGGEYAVLAFSAVRAGTARETAEQRETRIRQAGGRVARAEVTAYIEELRRKADIDTNPKAFE